MGASLKTGADTAPLDTMSIAMQPPDQHTCMHACMHVQPDATSAEAVHTWDPRYKEAVNECTSALDVAPNNQKALLRRAKALEAMGLYKQALSDVQKVNKLDDAPPENQVGAGRRVHRWPNASAPQLTVPSRWLDAGALQLPTMVLLNHLTPRAWAQAWVCTTAQCRPSNHTKKRPSARCCLPLSSGCHRCHRTGTDRASLHPDPPPHDSLAAQATEKRLKDILAGKKPANAGSSLVGRRKASSTSGAQRQQISVFQVRHTCPGAQRFW